MKTLLLIAVLIPFTLCARPLKVLFIGNSYTASNNLATMFEQLALSKGDTVRAFSVNPGGYTFQLHTQYPATLQMIDSMDWDFVVLQEQSQLPSFPPPQVATDVYPYARQLDSLIRLNNSCTETVFFMTWGRKYGDAANCTFYPPVCTFIGMQQQLRNSYVTMANDNQALVAPVGEAWRRSWMSDSTINLWISDNSHPDVPGTYLATCVFYSTIFRKSSAGASFTGGLSAAVANYLQLIADTTVFDSLATWRIGTYDVTAGFTVNTNGLNVQFNNTSVNADHYFWDFGDGTTDTVAQPGHTYVQSGTYPVMLIADNSCTADTIIFSLQLSSSSLDQEENMQCVKDLGNGLFQVECEGYRTLQIYDVQGRIVYTGRINGQGRISPELPVQGMYTLVFQRDGLAPVVWRYSFSR